ncbi:MAG: NAD(P)/FAD-dependent oxidoreductase, partial [Oscillospiraceae bacterium]|nr:NAD(P)/FAD-dependent oxidoreductase [Oscillospiraceae bacterium]
NVISGQEAYKHPEKCGENVVILGGGLVGTELSVYLSMLGGHKCTVLEMAPVLTFGGNHLQGNALNLQFKKYGIDVRTGTRALEVCPEGVWAEANGEKVLFKADTVVTAMGMRPNRDEALALADCAKEFFLAGDAKLSRSIREANWEGYQAAMDI